MKDRDEGGGGGGGVYGRVWRIIGSILEKGWDTYRTVAAATIPLLISLMLIPVLRLAVSNARAATGPEPST